MATPPHPLADFVCDQLRDWAPVTARRLFGGWGIYNGGVMFGLVARDAIYFRVDDLNKPDYSEIAGRARPFTYERPNGKRVEMAYCEVPPEILEDGETLPRWAAKAHAAALRAKASAGRARKPRNGG